MCSNRRTTKLTEQKNKTLKRVRWKESSFLSVFEDELGIGCEREGFRHRKQWLLGEFGMEFECEIGLRAMTFPFAIPKASDVELKQLIVEWFARQNQSTKMSHSASHGWNRSWFRFGRDEPNNAIRYISSSTERRNQILSNFKLWYVPDCFTVNWIERICREAVFTGVRTEKLSFRASIASIRTLTETVAGRVCMRVCACELVCVFLNWWTEVSRP